MRSKGKFIVSRALTLVIAISGGLSSTVSAQNFEQLTLENDSDSLVLGVGDSAFNNTINGGRIEVKEGGYAKGTQINSGGAQMVFDGGIADTTRVNNGGQLLLSERGQAQYTSLYSGGKMYMNGSAIAAETTLFKSPAEMYVSGGSLSKSTVARLGAAQFVTDNAIDDFAIIESGGLQFISGKATVKNTTVSGGESKQSFSDNAVGSDIKLKNNARQYVTDSAIVNNVTLISGESVTQILNGKSQSNYTTVLAGNLSINDNALAFGVEVKSKGYVSMHDKGRAEQILIGSGGRFSILSTGAQAKNIVIDKGGVMKVFAGKANNIVIRDGGTLQAYLEADITGVTVEEGGVYIPATAPITQ